MKNLNLKITGFNRVLLREIQLIKSDINILMVILLAPLFYAFFYPSIYVHKTEHDVPIVVVDQDKSALSADLIRYLDIHQLTKVTETVTDLEQAKDRIYSMATEGIIYIPDGFESNLKSGSGTDLKVYINTNRFLISNDINKAVNEVIGTMGAGIRLSYFRTNGNSFEQAIELIEPVRGDIRPMFNPSESYGDFLIPGLLVLIIQQTLLIGLSESMAKEREKHTLGNLFETANRSIWATIAGKASFFILLFGSYSFFMFTVLFKVFKLNFAGSKSALFVLTFLFLLSVIFLSLFVSSFFKRKILSMQFFVFTSYPIFLLSGYSWPLQSMPAMLRTFAYVLPGTPYLNAVVRITQMNAGWNHILPELLLLAILTLSGLLLTRLRMKQLINQELNENLQSPFFGMMSLFRLKRS
ncbi:MAG: ABC transporter permease [Calditrichaceae bacterium]